MERRPSRLHFGVPVTVLVNQAVPILFDGHEITINLWNADADLPVSSDIAAAFGVTPIVFAHDPPPSACF